MTTSPRQSAATSAIEVAVFDGGQLVSTKRCRGVSEARAFMHRAGTVAGFDCLIVSPRLRDSLVSTHPASAVA